MAKLMDLKLEPNVSGTKKSTKFFLTLEKRCVLQFK